MPKELPKGITRKNTIGEKFPNGIPEEEKVKEMLSSIEESAQVFAPNLLG